MPVKKQTLTRFKLFRNVAKPEYKNLVSRVIQMYENRNIGKEKEAENLLRQLVGPRPQNVEAKLEKYGDKEKVTGRLSRPIAKTLSKQTKKFFISGSIRTTQTWTESRRGKITQKTMTNKTNHPFAQTVEARDEATAREIYKQLAETDFNMDGYHLEEKVEDTGVTINQVVDVTKLKAIPTKEMKMKAVSPMKYEFIPSDESFNSGQGFCVPDQFISFYGPLIKKLDLEYFTKLCKEFYKIDNELLFFI